MNIKFSNGRELPIIMCYNHGTRFIKGETRENREIVLAEGVIGLDELKMLLANPDNLSVIQIIGEDGEAEILENFVYADEIKDTMKGEIWFTIGEKTALEIENQQAMETIDTLLIAMEV